MGIIKAIDKAVAAGILGTFLFGISIHALHTIQTQEIQILHGIGMFISSTVAAISGISDLTKGALLGAGLGAGCLWLILDIFRAPSTEELAAAKQKEVDIENELLATKQRIKDTWFRLTAERQKLKSIQDATKEELSKTQMDLQRMGSAWLRQDFDLTEMENYLAGIRQRRLAFTNQMN